MLNDRFGKGTIMESSVIKCRGLKFLTLLAFVMAACAVAAAENDYNDLESIEILTTLEQRMQKKISVNFRDMPIDDVIRIMAEQADVDIIKSPKVIGEVTATLTDVPLEEALNNILIAHDYGYVADKNMIRIAPVGEITARAETLVSKIFRITYADVTGVDRALQKFLSNRGSSSSSPGTSNIIVTDTQSKMKAIETFIKEIDRITPQVLIEVRIYDITTEDEFDLGIEWDAARNTPITTTVIGEVANTTTGVRAAATDITTKDTSTVWRASDAGETPSSYKYKKSKPFIGGSYDKTSGGRIRLGLLNDVVDIDIALTILHKQEYAKLLANPRILVLDNEKANFEIIREIPYTEVTATGDSTTETVKFKEVGIKLEVTPHITKDGMLRLHVIPEFGVRVGTGDPPTIDTRKINTIALVKDNQTIVLGGLRKKETTQDIWKVPILGDIPLLEGLFKSVSETDTINELLIFITPRIIIEPTLSPEELELLEATKVPSPKRRDVGLERSDN